MTKMLFVNMPVTDLARAKALTSCSDPLQEERFHQPTDPADNVK